MFGAIKVWLMGLSGLAKVGVGVATVAVAGTAIAAVPVAANTCTEELVTKESIEIETINPSDKYVLDGSLLSGETRLKTTGVAGEKNVKYSVVTKCNKQISKTSISSEETKAPTDNIVSKGTKRTITETVPVAFSSTTENNSSMDKGTTKIKTTGVNGSKKITYEVYQNEGEAEVKNAVSEIVVQQPVTQVTYVGTKVKQNCDPNYSGCVPIASDVDCAGGSGNGPAYVSGPVYVTGSDIYGLDRNGDGVGCE